MGILAAGIWTLLVLACWIRSLRGTDSLLPRNGSWLPLLLLAGCSGWVAVQLSPWGKTLDPHETRTYLLRSMTYLGAFALVVVLVQGERRRMRLLHGLLGVGLLQALLAIVMFSTGGQYELMGFQQAQAIRATGTYANADHLAQLMALCLSVGVALLLAQMDGTAKPPRHWRERMVRLLDFFLSTKMLVRLVLVIMVITLVLTRSRMGNGAFFISLLVMGLGAMVGSKRLRKPAAILVTSVLVVDAVIIGQWVGLDKVVQRLESTEMELASTAEQEADLTAPRAHKEESLAERLRAPLDGLRLVQQQPVMGHGGGTFYTLFPGIKRPELAGRFDHAHNDYVEIAADIGLPGLGLLAALMLLTLGRVLRLLLAADSTQHVRGVASGLGMALMCALLHALVDFNLQVTANALMLTVALAAVWSLPRPASAERSVTGNQ